MRLPELDPVRVREAVDLANTFYRLHEAGLPYSGELRQLARVTGQEVTPLDADGAFGSMASEDWAQDLLALSEGIPRDLTRGDLIEMIEAAQTSALPEWQLNWALRCLEAATGCADIISIFDTPQPRSAAEIVDAAYASPQRILITPPPQEPS